MSVVESDISRFTAITEQLVHEAKGRGNFAAALPALLHLKGKPYSIKDRMAFEEFFNFLRPKKRILLCGRQQGKTTVIGSEGILTGLFIPNFRRMYVMPTKDMSMRLSTEFVDPFIDNSPIKPLLQSGKMVDNKGIKRFTNGSTMYFLYALLNCDRTRGIPCDANDIDEIQDMDYDFLPIIHQTLAGSPDFGFITYTGTAKTTDNTAAVLYDESSQSEWCMRCGCGHWNIPALEYDALKIIGPVENIDKYGTGLICAKCGRPLYGNNGVTVHRYEDRINEFSGWHIPQIVLPLHYTSKPKWRTIHAAMRSDNRAVFFNEVLGIPTNESERLIKPEDIQRASCLPVDNSIEEAVKYSRNRYTHMQLGVDWGGRGQSHTSYTALALVGRTVKGEFEVPFVFRCSNMANDVEEAQFIADLFLRFRCDFLAHDAGGAGQQHESILIQLGFPYHRLIPLAYTRATRASMIRYVTSEVEGERNFFSVDKTRSLQLTCLLMQSGRLRLPAYEKCKDLVSDFLALRREEIDQSRGNILTLVVRDPKKSDDIAQAINFGLCGLYQASGEYPDITPEIVSEEELRRVEALADLRNVPQIALPTDIPGAARRQQSFQ